MAKQALDTIKKSEEQSRQLLEKAHADAAQLVSDANRKAEEEIERVTADCKKTLEQEREKATRKAEEEQQAFVAETADMGRELEQKLMARQDAAVEAVMKAVSGQ